jgi:NAD(P)-dependent dehydrogenase (short-subunit alcohol dehydrogenase family)
MRLSNRTAIVTGVGLRGNGIGTGIAKVLASEGADVAVFDIYERNADDTAEDLQQYGGQSLAYAVDVADYTRFQHAVDDVLSRWGRIDILCNNAGVCHERVPEPCWETSENEFDRIVAVNCKGVWNGCRAVVPPMIERRYGKIINISSIVGKQASAGAAIYAASKYFIHGLTSSLAAEIAKFNINVNCVAPGLVRTSCLDRLMITQAAAYGDTPEQAFERNLAPIPMHRPQTPKDIGKAVAFLASDDSGEITGQCITVDGGHTHI